MNRRRVAGFMHQRLAVLLGSLAFFVAIVDMLVRVAISHSGTLARVLAEDSGEMVVVSLTVAFSLTVYRRYGRNPGQPSPMS